MPICRERAISMDSWSRSGLIVQPLATHFRVHDFVEASFQFIGDGCLWLRLRLVLVLVGGPRMAGLTTGTGWGRIVERGERSRFREGRVGHEGTLGGGGCEGEKGAEGRSQATPELLLSMSLGGGEAIRGPPGECWSLGNKDLDEMQ